MYTNETLENWPLFSMRTSKLVILHILNTQLSLGGLGLSGFDHVEGVCNSVVVDMHLLS